MTDVIDILISTRGLVTRSLILTAHLMAPALRLVDMDASVKLELDHHQRNQCVVPLTATDARRESPIGLVTDRVDRVFLISFKVETDLLEVTSCQMFPAALAVGKQCAQTGQPELSHHPGLNCQIARSGLLMNDDLQTSLRWLIATMNFRGVHAIVDLTCGMPLWDQI